jgi:Hint module
LTHYIYQADNYDLTVAFLQEGYQEDYKTTGVNFPETPPPSEPIQAEPQPECIESESALREVVKNCKRKMNETSCLLDICSIRLPITGGNTSSSHGLDISNKNIVLSCEKTCPKKRCILDGLGRSRLFYGSNTNITFLNFVFMNGYHPYDGGSIKLEGNSIVTAINCSFYNNSAQYGSAIRVQNSQLKLSGSETSFVNNTGRSPPLEVLSSRMNISQAIFAGNQVTDYQAAVFLYDSAIEIYQVQYFKSQNYTNSSSSSSGHRDEDCHVYIAIDETDVMNKSSCMTFDTSTQSMPIIDVSDYCPTPAPTPSAPSPSTPTLATSGSPQCFSNQNMVEIQAIGPIPIDELRIGDMVKSMHSDDNMFTQVYGFGHLDHHQEGIYLHITFDDNINTMTSTLSEQASFLEISSRHLVMIEKKNDTKQFYIPAGNVRIGDILSGRRVQTIQPVVRQGMYAPLTQSGTIVVNGIMTSNYVELIAYPILGQDQQHTLAHRLFHPQRFFCYYYFEMCHNEIYWNGYGIWTYWIISCHSLLHQFQTLFGMI